MHVPDGFVVVAYVDDDGQLRELRVPILHAHIARERGWMVWTDFEDSMKAARPQADGDDGG